MEYQPEFGKIVRYHRKKTNLSAQALADLAGVSPSSVYEFERGKTSIELAIVEKIFNALNIKITLSSPLIDKYMRDNDAHS